MLRDPVLFLAGQHRRIGGRKIPLVQLVGVKRLVEFHLAHGVIQLFLQVLPGPADGKVDVGAAGLGNGRHVRVGQVGIQVIDFPAHRQLTEQHVLCTVLGVGNTSHQVDLAAFHHLEQV